MKNIKVNLIVFLLLLSTFSKCISASEKVIVSYRIDSAPIQFKNSLGEADGLLIGYWKKIAKYADFELEFIGEYSKHAQQLVIDKEADVNAGLFGNKKRLKLFDFSKPIAYSPYFLFFKKNKNITSLKQAEQLLVGVTAGSYHENYIQEHYPQIKLKAIEGYSSLFKAAKNDEIDAFVTQESYLKEYLLKNNLANSYTHLPDYLYNRAYRAAVVKGNKNLLDKINTGIAQLTEEDIFNLTYKWLTKAKKLKLNQISLLTPKEQAFLDEHPFIKIGIDKAWAPFEYVDEQGFYQGLSSSYISFFSQQLGIDFTPEPNLSWEQVIFSIKNKKLDVLPAVSIAPDREKFLNFTDSYFSYNNMIFVHKHSHFVTSLDDLDGHKVGVEKDYVTEGILREKHKSIIVETYPDTKSVLIALSKGEVDAYLGGLATTLKVMDKQGFDEIKIAAPTDYKFEIRIAVRNDWPELVSILNKTLASLSYKQKKAFKNQWFEVNLKHQVDRSKLWQAVFITAFVFIIILMIIFIWNRRLKIEVEQRLVLEDKLKENLHWVEELLEKLPIPFFVKDKQLNFTYTNSKFRNFVGKTKRQLIGYNEFEVFDDELAIRYDNFLKSVIEQGQVNQEVILQDATGAKHNMIYFGSTLQTKNNKINGLIGVFLDISDRKKMEIALKKAREHAEEASQYKSEFLGNMSHEIRTPINAIVGFCYMLLQSQLSDKQYNFVDKIQISSNALLSIINDILDYSKIEAGKLLVEKNPFKLDDVLNYLSDLTSLEAEQKGLEIIFDMSANVPQFLIGDQLRIQQTLLNLVQNAIKFTKNGEIIIRILVKGKGKGYCKLRFEVHDTGIGIETANLKRLFQSFSQEDGSITRKYGGTGLGLTISKNLIELMGGNIGVKSKVAKGSCFYFDLTFDIQQGKQAKKAIKRDHSLKLLVVDDNLSARVAMNDMLISFGYLSSNVATGDEAVTALQSASLDENNQPYDIVLMDWKVPKKGGLETTKQIKRDTKIKPQPAIVILSSNTEGDKNGQIEQIGVAGYLYKPVSPSILFNHISQIINSKGKTINKIRHLGDSFELLKGNVLLVEDNAINMEVANEIVSSFGINIIPAQSVEVALEKLKNQKIDLVITDIQMPGMDGYEFAKIIRQDKANDKLPIIAMTANAMVGEREKCLAVGINEHIAKPISPNETYQKLSYWLSKTGEIVKLEKNKKSPNIKIENLDFEVGMQRTGGKQKLYEKLLKDFVIIHDQDSKKIRKALTERDFVLLERTIHTIKGVTANIGAKRLSELASKIETKFMQKQLINNDEDLLKFERMLVKLTKDIQDYFSIDHSESNIFEKISVLREEEIINGFEKALKGLDIQTIPLYKDAEKVLLKTHSSAKLQQLKSEIMNYEFEKALKIYKQINKV